MDAEAGLRRDASSEAASGRVDEALERATAFYELFLWESSEARLARSYLAKCGLEDDLLRSFQVGFAPFGWFELQEHLAEWGYSADELRAAGLVHGSRRGERLYDYFRSRIVFPIKNPEGRILGFAGLALHPAPSWPKWLASPESGRFQRGGAMFGVDRATGAIERAGQAIVLTDCIEVLRSHQRGQRETVAVIRSDVTGDHVRQLEAYAPNVMRGNGEREGLFHFRRWATRATRPRSWHLSPAVVSPADRSPDRPSAAPSPIRSGGTDAEDWDEAPDAPRPRVAPHRRAAAVFLIALMIVLSLSMWIAIPVAWLWIGSQLTETQQPSGTAYFIVGVGILASMLGVGYLLARLNRMYMHLTARHADPRVHTAWLKSMRAGEDEVLGRGVLDVIMIGSAVIAIVAMAGWFFFLAGAPK